MEVESAGRRAARAGRSRCAFGHRFRRVRRRLPALQRSQLSGESAAGARSHRPVDEEESVASRNRELPEDGAMSTRKIRSRARKPKSSRPHMLGYGLPEGNKGLLPWSWAEQRLKKSHNYCITTVKPGSSAHSTAPHTMVVWGLWQDGR